MLEELTQEVTLLVIDDQESMREGCRQTLEEQGHRTLVAGNGEEGLRMVKEYEPNLVLVDLKMPGMSGMEVIDEIRKIDPHIVTIVITGYGSIDSAVGAMKRGTSDYLTKPFGPEMLVDAVNRGIEQYGRQMRAEELDQEKETAMGSFAAFVSHQLKSPAAVAAQYIEVVIRELAGSLTDKQRSALEGAYRRTEDLTMLIRDWLKLGQLDAGMLETDFKPVELGRVVERAWNAVSDEEGRSRITLNIEVWENVKPVDGDEDLLREAFTNLFNNSVKFTSGPGEITVRLAPEGKYVAVSVKDTGIGIPEEEQAHLFEPFYRGARAGVKRIGGFGLGLSIVKKIISVHGGTIAVASTPGQGATFALKLPTKAGTSAITSSPPEIVAVKPELSLPVAPQAFSSHQLSNFVERMLAEQTVVGVKEKEGTPNRFVFGALESASQLRLDYEVTILPPKKYLMPPRETLVKFSLDAAPQADPCVEEPQPTVLLGVHPYDMIAINQLDRMMFEVNPDPNYLARRAALTIIGVDPTRASQEAFWVAMGCAKVENGFDLWLTDIGGTYVVEVGSEKGTLLLEKFADVRDVTERELAVRSTVRERLKDLGTNREIKFHPFELPNLLRRSVEHNIWKEKSEKCFSCGSCNLVCPTCYCFDVKDAVDMSLKEGDRSRVWDGCLLEDFAKVGTGENFREERLQRYRHRFYRKGMHLYDRYGYIGCVGCGRCVTACLPDVADPVAVFNALKGDRKKDIRRSFVSNRRLYTPDMATVARIEALGGKEKLFEIRLDSGRSLDHKPGQFVELSVLGIGEAPISITSSPTRSNGSFELAVREVGSVTGALHRMEPGGKVGIRGPLGTCFPLEAMKGQDVLFVAGGIGLFPLRSAINEVIDNREHFGRVIILLGAKSPAERMFADELELWRKNDGIEYLETVDRADDSWRGNVGVITTLFPKLTVTPARTYCLIVGPPIMQRFTVWEARKKGLPDDRIILSLERRMRCGVGKCGHCQINGVYVCQDGPVFRYSQIRDLPEAL